MRLVIVTGISGAGKSTALKMLEDARYFCVDNLPVPIVEQPKPVSFKKLEVQTPVTGTQAAVIIRLNGATVEVNDGTSQQTIQAVLLALQSIC